jgi:hypothetical protein
VDILSIYAYFTLGTFYWASLVKERNHGFVSPLSQSPLVPRKEEAIGLVIRLKTLFSYHPMSHTPACGMARTEDKRRLSQPNYLDPSRENRWREVEGLA